ncbi:hypothetical protein Tco_0331307 [Tanacetum coccineum]
MRELREDTFSGNKNKDAHDHVDRVLNIVSLFNISGVSQDVVLLRVFPFTLTGFAKRWLDRLTSGGVNTWDLLKKPLSKGIVHHPRPLNDLKTSTTSSKKAMNRYTKLGNDLTAIQTMAEHSQKWHEGTSSRNISSSSDTDRLAAVIRPHLDKECPLNEEVKQVYKVKYGEFGRPAPFNGSSGVKFCVGLPRYYTRIDNQTSSGEKKPNLVETINKYMEEASKRQAKQDERLQTFCQNTKNSRIAHDKIIQKLESHVKTLAAEVETNVAQLEEFKMIFANDRTPLYTPFYYSSEEIKYFSSTLGFLYDEKSKTTKVKTSKAILEWKSNLLEQTVNHYVKPHVPPIAFLNRLKQHDKEALVHKTMESLKKIKIN